MTSNLLSIFFRRGGLPAEERLLASDAEITRVRGVHRRPCETPAEWRLLCADRPDRNVRLRRGAVRELRFGEGACVELKVRGSGTVAAYTSTKLEECSRRFHGIDFS